MTDLPDNASSGPPAGRPSRDAAVRGFVRARYGPTGTLRLHRSAIGLDLLRAPVNVALAPLYLLVRLAAVGAVLLGLSRLGDRLWRCRLLFETDVSRRIRADLAAFLETLEASGLGPAAGPRAVEQAVRDYVAVRNAVAEITTSLTVLIAGLTVFHLATPGVVSLAGPVAAARAQAAAVAAFPFGERLGRVWYGAFPADLGAWEVVATGLVLAMLASVLTTFAGLLADPLQVATGTHRRRLLRLLGRLDVAEGRARALESEHLAARLGDFGDAAVSLWRALRG